MPQSAYPNCKSAWRFSRKGAYVIINVPSNLNMVFLLTSVDICPELDIAKRYVAILGSITKQ